MWRLANTGPQHQLSGKKTFHRRQWGYIKAKVKQSAGLIRSQPYVPYIFIHRSFRSTGFEPVYLHSNMLVKDLIASLQSLNPSIYNTLTLRQLTQFATLSAEFLHRTCGAYATTPNQAPIEFLTHCLDSAQPITTWPRLWHITHHTLPTCLYDPNHFQNHGIPGPGRLETAIIIPQNTFNPPTDFCLHCLVPDCNTLNKTPTRHHKLEMRQEIHAYLFDVGGIETVQYFTAYCRSEPSGFSLNLYLT